MPVDVLLFGAHPDDVEWGAGGMMLLLQRSGMTFAIADLTKGEMGSRGAVENREVEAQAAAKYLQAEARTNLGMPDCHLVDAPQSRRHIADVIRQYRPSIVLAPYWRDRHPDHAATGKMVRNAALFCTLKKLNSPHPPHKPKVFLYYLLHHYARPTCIVDISDVYERKIELMRLHQSQFSKTAEQFGVLAHGFGDYLFALESRDRYFGSFISKRHGEALVSDQPLPLKDLGGLVQLMK